MLARLLPLVLLPMVASAADAPAKPVPVTIRPVQTKPAAPTPVATRPVAPARPQPLPFPAPVQGPVTQDTRYSAGDVAVVDPDKKTFEINTPAGHLVCSLGETSRIIGGEGHPILLTDLAVGSTVRVYYRTGKKAEVLEADLVAAPH